MAATESSNWFIDQAVKEYEALQAGSLDVFANSTAAPGGEIEYCGSLDDMAHWTAVYVRAEDEALLPLAVGPLERVLANFAKIDRADTPIWDPQVFPPPVIVIDGTRQHFRPARGRYLIGAVTTERRAVLLAAVGETLAVVHLDSKSRTVLFRGSPFSFREIDVDALLEAPRGSAPRPKVVRPPSSVRSHHARIVGQLPVDVGDGPAIPDVLWCCFEDLRRRAAVVPRTHPRQRRKGKTKLEVVVRALYEAGLVGCGNFEGLSGEILAQLKIVCPTLEFSAEVFADVLRLLHATKSCIIEHPSPRIWRIRLIGLNDPRSPHHRQFCKETAGLYKHDLARTMPATPLPTSSPARPTAPSPISSTGRSTNASPTSPPDPPAPPPTNATPTSPPASASEPRLELAGQVLSGPAAALAVLLLAMRATAQAEAHEQAIARATSQVEHEEKLTEHAVAEAVSARLAPEVGVVAAEVPAATAGSRSPIVSEPSTPRARPRQLRPLFAAMSCIASPLVGRARRTLAGLLPVAPPTPEVDPDRRRWIRSDVSEVGGALASTHRSLILGALGARGPPAPRVEPSQR